MSSRDADETSSTSQGDEDERRVLEALRRKEVKAKQRIDEEQHVLQRTIDEYIGCMSRAEDSSLQARLKEIFERKKSRSTATISGLQNKLANYQRRLEDARKRMPRTSLPTSLETRSTSASSPSLPVEPRQNTESDADHHREDTTPSRDEGGLEPAAHRSMPLLDAKELLSRAPSPSPLEQELLEMRRDLQALEERLNRSDQEVRRQSGVLQQTRTTVHEDRHKVTSLEEQITDWTELHQSEMGNLRAELANLEEKLEYQLNDRLVELREQMQTIENKMSSFEKDSREARGHDSLENASAKQLLFKLFNVLLTLSAIMLVLVTTAGNMVKPFVNSWGRTVSTLVLVSAAVVVSKYWDAICQALQATQ